MSEVKPFLTPVGRIVAGDVFEPQTKDAEGNPLTIKTGPNAGQPRVQFFIALAIAKTDPAWPALHALIWSAAREGFPNLFDTAGNCLRPGFAFKITDGDSQIPNSRGIKPCDREGYAGHWVLNFSNGFEPKCYTAGGAEQIVDKNAIKRGYYARVYGGVVGNGSTQQPGVFLNFSMVELVAYGEEIHSGPDAAAVFGAAPVAALPAGASRTPAAPATPPLAAPGAPAAPAIPGAPAAPGFQAPAGVQPHPGFLNGPGTGGVPPAPAPAAPAAPAPAPAADPKRRLTDGNIYTESQLRAAGWQPAQIAALPLVP